MKQNEVLSPLSGKIMYKQFRTTSAIYKGVEVFYEFEYYKDGEHQFTTTASDDRSMNNLKKAYQDKMESLKNKMWGEMNSTEKCEYLKTINHLGNEEFYKKLDEVGFQKYKEQKMERPSHDETEELWDSITGKIDNGLESTYDSFKGIIYESLIEAILGYKEEIDEKGMKGTNFVQKEGDLDNQPEMWMRTTNNPEWEPVTGTLDVKDNPSIGIQNTIVPPEIDIEFGQAGLLITNYNEALEWWGLLNISEKMGVRRQFGIADKIGVSLEDIQGMYEMETKEVIEKSTPTKQEKNESKEWWESLTDEERIYYVKQFYPSSNDSWIKKVWEQEAMEKPSQDEEEMGADRYKIITDIKAISEEEKTTVLNERYKIVIDMTNCDDTKFLRSLVKYISDGAMTIKIEPIDGTK